MPNKKDIRAAILNESSTDFERLAVKIIKLPGGTNFIKTYVHLKDRSNRDAIKKLGDELLPTGSRGFLGIGIVSYPTVNCLEFYSAFKSFKLNKGDEITLVFEEKEVKLEFSSVYKTYGYLKKNSCFVPDSIMQFIANNKLEYWKLTDNTNNITLAGGFEANEANNQYGTVKAGQKLLQDMIKEIFKMKPQLLAEES